MLIFMPETRCRYQWLDIPLLVYDANLARISFSTPYCFHSSQTFWSFSICRGWANATMTVARWGGRDQICENALRSYPIPPPFCFRESGMNINEPSRCRAYRSINSRFNKIKFGLYRRNTSSIWKGHLETHSFKRQKKSCKVEYLVQIKKKTPFQFDAFIWEAFSAS